jgi:tetratricopeptide (TPR) repeat protein
VSLLAEELARTERMEDVRRAYLAAHRAGVSSEGSYLNLALACHRLRRGADAMDALREGARLFPESVDLHYRYGRLLLDAGRTSNAEAELRRALELGSTRNDVRLHLGLTLQRAGRIDEAARVLRQVEDLARGSKEGERAREALSRLQATP